MLSRLYNVFGSSEPAPTAKSNASADKPAETISLMKVGYHLLKLFSDLSANGSATLESLKALMANWESAIDRIMIIVKDVGLEIEKMDDTAPEDKDAPNLRTAWKEFNEELTKVTTTVKELSACFSPSKNTSKDEKQDGHVEIYATKEEKIAHKLNDLLIQIPKLSNSFDNLGLNGKLTEILPTSFKELVGNFGTYAAKTIEDLLPKNLEEKIVEVFKSSEPLTKEKFAKLPRYQQAGIILGMEQINRMFQDAFVEMDKIGIKLSVKEDYLLNRRISFLNNKTLREYCDQFYHLYTEYQEVTHYTITDEQYPYVKSITRQRNEMLKVLDAALEKERHTTTQAHLNAKIKALALIDAELDHTNRIFLKNKVPLLEALRLHLNNNLTFTNALTEMRKKYNITPLQEDGSGKALEQIKELYAKIEKDERFRCAGLLAQKNRLLNRKKTYSEKYKKLTDEVTAEELALKIADDNKNKAANDNKNEAAKKAKPVEALKSMPADVIAHVYGDTIESVKKDIDRLKLEIYGPQKPEKPVGEQKKEDDKKEEKPGPSSIEIYMSKLDNKLKEMLDPYIYQEFFTDKPIKPLNLNADNKHAPKPAESALAAPRNKPSEAWIQHLGSSIVNINRVIATHKTKTPEEEGKRAATAALDLIQTADKLKKSFSQLTDTTIAFSQLKNDPFIQDVVTIVVDTFDPVRKVKIPNELVIPNANKQSGLYGILNRFEDFYKTHSSRYPQGKKSNEAVTKAIHATIASLDAFKRYNPDQLHSLSSLEYISFAIKNKDLLFTELLGNLMQGLFALIEMSREFYLHMCQEINLFLRDLYLVLDKLEMQFYLKEGYISDLRIFGGQSLNNLVQAFNKTVESINFEFKPEERYPYTEKILEQRKALLGHTKSKVEYDFIEKRAKDAAEKLATERALQKTIRLIITHYNNSGLNIETLALIDGRLDELRRESSRCKESSLVKIKKIKLLEKLRKIYLETPKKHKLSNFIQSNTQIDKLLDDEDVFQTREDIHLLFEGRTGNILKQLRAFGTTKNDLINKIDLRIELLKQQREEKFWFSAQSKRTIVENTIYAYQQLQVILKQKGYNFNEAFDRLKINDLDSYNVLYQNEKPFLHEMLYLDEYVLSSKTQKKTVDFIPAPKAAAINPPVALGDMKAVPPANMDPYATGLIETRINDLIVELKKAWFFTSTKENKIKVLEALKLNLTTMPLEKALKAIRENAQTNDIYYLLYEGRTGAMMKSVHLNTLSINDIIHHIDLELIRLKELRYESLNYSSQQRKKDLEECIYCLTELKKNLQSGIYDINGALDYILPYQRHAINLLAPKLFDDIKNWAILHKGEKFKLAPVTPPKALQSISAQPTTTSGSTGASAGIGTHARDSMLFARPNSFAFAAASDDRSIGLTTFRAK